LSFLQMAEMEQSSFCLMITSPERSGKLHVAKGVLIDAETANHTGRDAAYRIIAWEDVTIQIAPVDPSKKDQINQPLMHVLMESLKIKDEITKSFEAPPVPPPRAARPEAGMPGAPGKRLVRLERVAGPKSRFQRPSLARMAVVALTTLVVVGSIMVLTLYYLSIHAETDLFDKLNKEVEKAAVPEEKLALLEKYLKSNPQTPHESDIKHQIEEISKSIEDRDFEQVQLQISSLPINEEYENKAITMYGDFLEKYPNSRYQKRINTAINDIKNLLDQYYYEELKQAARLDFGKRLQVYRQYLQRFPKGKYHQDVNVLIQEMGQQYLSYLKTEDEQCDKLRRWEPCIERYQTFISEYEGLPLAEAARNTITMMKDKQELLKLRAEREEAGNDYARAIRAYENYLQEHPNSTQRTTIDAELAELKKNLGTQRQWETVRSYALNESNGLFERIQKVDRYINEHHTGPYTSDAQELMRQLEMQRQQSLKRSKIEAKRQEELARQEREKERIAKQKAQVQQMRTDLEAQLSHQKRYRVNGDDTFTDLKTGQVWTLLDSFQELGGCLDYDAAEQYVQSLQTGGHQDWRLPKANELATIYKQRPFFPGSGADWYWTSERYTKGYHTVVDIVTAKPESVFNREQRDTSECGTVRAVRP
ncbi:MAG: DUF1566 domain-containing protein, partial [Desulfobacteraceae bacterium]|nr:DUF1566 domain-containing protein [Desulfobacteraceae bacterium]